MVGLWVARTHNSSNFQCKFTFWSIASIFVSIILSYLKMQLLTCAFLALSASICLDDLPQSKVENTTWKILDTDLIRVLTGPFKNHFADILKVSYALLPWLYIYFNVGEIAHMSHISFTIVTKSLLTHTVTSIAFITWLTGAFETTHNVHTDCFHVAIMSSCITFVYVWNIKK